MARSGVTVQQTQRMALSPGLVTSIRILRDDAETLTRQLEELAAENPQLVLTRPPAHDWLPRWKAAFDGEAMRSEPVAAGPSLVAAVMDMVGTMELSAEEARIAEAIVGALEPTGWLGRPLGEIAREARASVAATEAMLIRLQEKAEPSGLFARSLSECLRLQAKEAGELCPVMTGLLERLDILARGDIPRLAREIGYSADMVRDAIRLLRGYDPKPGTRYETFAAPVREPDLVAEPGPGGWTIALNRSALPSLAVKPGRGKDHAAAREMVRMIEGRNSTLLAVALEVLNRQSAALDEGFGALQPLTMAEVAEALGLHESTVSRVVAGASVDTPRGTWWLRSLFSQAPVDGGPSAAALRARITQIVGGEDPEHPLSDDQIAERLAEEGAPVARRTVAKYRQMQKLPPAHRRRRRQ